MSFSVHIVVLYDVLKLEGEKESTHPATNVNLFYSMYSYCFLM